MKKTIVSIMILALTGCTATVDDKYYIPEFTKGHEECFNWTRSGCTNGKDLQVKVPECWRLVIGQGIDSTDICVSKEVFERTQIGQEWTDETYVV